MSSINNKPPCAGFQSLGEHEECGLWCQLELGSDLSFLILSGPVTYNKIPDSLDFNLQKDHNYVIVLLELSVVMFV